MEIVGLIAGVTSIILAIIAIWQTMYFYSKGKDTESRVEIALEGIKAQVNTLQSVNTRITDRLTRFVTTPRDDAAQTSELLAVALKSLPDIALKFFPPTQTTNESTLRNEIMLAYVALWNSLATTNIWAAFSLPSPETFDPQNSIHALVKHVVDRTAADFKYMSGIVNQLRREDILQSHFAHLYQEVINTLQPFVGDTSEHFARTSKQRQS